MRNRRPALACWIQACCAAVVLVAGGSRLSHTQELQLRNVDRQLFDAVRRGSITRVREAIRKGANASARDELGDTPLHHAQKRDITEALIKAGADLRAKNTEFGMTPLFNATVAVSRVLIQSGADVNAKGRTGVTPLAWAVYWDQKDKITLLLSNGADVHARDDNGKSPLHIAANWSKVDIMRLLIARGADVDAKDNDCWTPLHWAAFEGDGSTMDALISAGAKRDAASCRDSADVPAGSTPFDVAARWRSSDVSGFLKSQGYDNRGPQ